MEVLNDLNEKGMATGYQYIVVNGERYYFDRKFVSDYGLKDAQIDAFRADIAQKSNIEISEQTYKKNNNGYRSIGIMPNGNYIVYDSKNKYGVFDSNGNIIIPFIYDKIEPIMKKNGEIVHEDFYVAQRKERKIVNPKDGAEFYVGDSKTGMISSKGVEILPFSNSKVDKIIYEEEKDLIHCVNNGNYKGVYAQGGFAGYEKDVVTIDGTKLEQEFSKQINYNEVPETFNSQEKINNQELVETNPEFIDQFNVFIKKYNNYLTLCSGDTMKIDTNFASQLLDDANYLMDELIKMKDSVERDELVRYGMQLEQYANNLQNHINLVNQASSIFKR